jgi:hypothetical protein
MWSSIQPVLLLALLPLAPVLGAQTRFVALPGLRADPADQLTAAVLLADVDRDQDLDLVVVNGGWSGFEPARLYRNDGFGRLAPAAAGDFPATPLPGTSVAAGDLDQDGDVDLVIGCFGLGRNDVRNRIYRNDGQGRFADATDAMLPRFTSQCATYEFSAATRAVLLGDFDRDGDLDIYFANWCQDRLYRNEGGGRFVDATTLLLPPEAQATNAVAAGDVDGDGDLDLVLGNAEGALGGDKADRLLLNDGTGRFQFAPPDRLVPDHDETFGVALADLDRDGDLDLIAANSGPQFGLADSGRNRILRNDGNGRFTDGSKSMLPPGLAASRAVLAADLDLDGSVDLLFGNATAWPLSQDLLLRNGGDRFMDRTAEFLPPMLDQTWCLAAGDLDRDGDPDLVLGNHGGNQVLFNRYRQVEGGIAEPGRPYRIRVYATPLPMYPIEVARIFAGGRARTIDFGRFGTGGVDPALAIELPVQVIRAEQGWIDYDYFVPDLPALRGFEFHVQALLIPQHMHLTNVLRDRVR